MREGIGKANSHNSLTVIVCVTFVIAFSKYQERLEVPHSEEGENHCSRNTKIVKLKQNKTGFTVAESKVQEVNM